MEFTTKEEFLFEDTLFYPGLRIYPKFKWIDPSLTPPNEVTIIIQYDEVLHLGDASYDNKQMIILYPNSDDCILFLTASQTVSCEEGIQIPWNMTYKTLDENANDGYSVVITSYDVDLSGNAVSNTKWTRSIQNMTLSLEPQVSSGRFIEIKGITVDDTRIVQSVS